MKKRIINLLSIFTLLIVGLTATTFTGCAWFKAQSTQRVAVNTLFSIHKTADAALDGYLDLVIQGKVATNSVPKVLSAYGTFQTAYNAAVGLVVSNTNAVAPQAVVDAAAAFTATVTTATKGSP